MKKQLYQGIFWRGLYYVSVFCLNIVIARLFQAKESGSLNYIINNLAFVILCTSISLESGMGYYAVKNKLSQSKLAWLSLFMSTVSVISSFLILQLVPALGLNSTDRWYLPVLYVGGLVLWNYVSALFYAKFDYILPNVIGVVNNIVLAIVAYIFFKNPSDSPGENTFLNIYFVSFVLQAFVLFTVYAYRSGAFSKIQFPNKQELKKLFKYSLLAFTGNVIFFLVYRLDYWFVKQYCDAKELGNYIQVSKLVQVFLLIPTFISSVIFTKTAGDNSGEHPDAFKLISRFLTTAYLLIILVVVVCGEWLFPMVYGPTFNLIYLVFLLSAPGIISLSSLALLAAYYAGRNQMKVNIIGAIVALGIIVAGNILFTPRFGIYAAAIVNSVAYILFYCYAMFCFKKDNPESQFSDFFFTNLKDIRAIRNIIFSNAAK